jgi:hypothetical protein
MKNNFGDSLRQMRDIHFPGKGLKSVCDQLLTKGNDDFGGYFFTQLSRMENGQILPSEKILGRIMEAYDLNTEEKILLLEAYMEDRMKNITSQAGQKIMGKDLTMKVYRKNKTDKGR